MSFKKAAGALVFMALFVTACGDKKSSGNALTSLLTQGSVRDDTGGFIKGAKVCSGTTGSCVTSDANGYFALTMHVESGSLVANVSAPGYGSASRRFPIGGTIGTIALHKLDESLSVTLPTAGQSPVTIPFAREGGNMTLTINGASLVDSSGAQAVGKAVVDLAAWTTKSDPSSYPGILKAESPNGPVNLVTYGMAHIEITQNGNKLQVAPGQNLIWTIQEPNDSYRGLFLKGTPSSPVPNLYSLNEETGLWHYESNLDGNTMSYDLASGTFTMKLAHLSAWNADGTAPDLGGCISGYVYSPCDQTNLTPLVGQSVTLWTMSYEETRMWYANKHNPDTGTNSAGRYCIDIPISRPEQGDGQNNKPNSQQAWFFVAGRGDWRNTSMTNPFAAHPECFGDNFIAPDGTVQNCEYQWQYEGAVDYYSFFCSHCVCNDCFSADAEHGDEERNAQNEKIGEGPGDPPRPYQTLPVKSAASVAITADGPPFNPYSTPNCSDSTKWDLCAQAPPTYMRDPKCPSVPVGNLKLNDPCTDSKGNRVVTNIGDACGYQGYFCCDSAKQQWKCSDFVCVPK